MAGELWSLASDHIDVTLRQLDLIEETPHLYFRAVTAVYSAGARPIMLDWAHTYFYCDIATAGPPPLCAATEWDVLRGGDETAVDGTAALADEPEPAYAARHLVARNRPSHRGYARQTESNHRQLFTRQPPSIRYSRRACDESLRSAALFLPCRESIHGR